MSESRCITSARAVPVRQVEDVDVDVRERVAQRLDPAGIRAVAAADEQGALVQPERVAALRRGRGREPGRDGYAGRLEVERDRLGLGEPALLAGAQHDRAAVADDRRVEDVDGVGVRLERRLREHDLGARVREQRAERLVLGRELDGVRGGAPAVLAPERRVGGAGRAQQHAAQRPRRVLAAEARHAFASQRSRSSRVRRSCSASGPCPSGPGVSSSAGSPWRRGLARKTPSPSPISPSPTLS